MRKLHLLFSGAALALTFSLFASTSAQADTVTDVNISSYYNGNWNSPAYTNGAQIAAAPTSGNTGSGLTFGDWFGHHLRQLNNNSTTLSLGSVPLNANATVNTLINSVYGSTGVQATLNFLNNMGQTASFNLIGGETIRDYNNGANPNTLSPTEVGGVTALNWWNDGTGPGTQRLDAQIFVLPSSWAGTDLVSVTFTDPNSANDNPILSALQVDDRSAPFVPPGSGGTSAVPEPSTLLLFGTGLTGFLTAVRRRVPSQPAI